MLGRTLFVRNSEWVDGTMLGLTVAFAGSNTDVEPNDLLPITSETHENEVCTRACIKKHSVRKATKQMQRAQATTNGYFGGYIGK